MTVMMENSCLFYLSGSCFGYSQLFYDGYKDQAVSLAQVIKPFPACPPSDRLFSIFRAGYKIEEGIKNTSSFFVTALWNIIILIISVQYVTDSCCSIVLVISIIITNMR